uniref:protein trichome birefringence-like 16 n=1 Tax=Erigeron canadensis TaxID=72917 RepID=UPI001CB967BC|nr:protein trichome birefringence-like 16 [Erigeron canadensis]XP_043636080.1 protein trichome birefringence-like 16 [Erigeron canadensis]
MKGGGGYLHGMKMKQLCLLFLVFICASIVIWNWEKTPLLTTITTNDHQQVLHLLPDDDGLNTQVQDDFIQAQDLLSPSLSTRYDDEFRKTSRQKNHHGNTTTVVEESVSQVNDSLKPLKQHLITSVTTSQTPESDVNEVIDTPITNIEKPACNYGKGKWVPAENRPLYSGFGCKQWLSGMWACRLTQRTDFGYEKLKWQPKHCKMEDFTRSKFLKRMQDKTLAFVGDSLGRQQFQSLMCMVTGGEELSDVEDVGKEYGLVLSPGSTRPDGWAYRFLSTNTTILYYWSASLCDLEPIDPTNPTTDYAMHLDRPPAFLKHFLDKIHALVLNTGHHWNRGKLNANRWVMYVGGKPNTDRRIADIGGAKNLTIYSVVKWVDSQLPKHPELKAFFRSISPRHFFNGEWNTGGTCDSTTPGSLEVLQDESSDPIAAGAVKGTNVKLLDITGLSLVREEGHISRYSIRAAPGMQDCLHWCLPGVPDTWNELLFAQI